MLYELGFRTAPIFLIDLAYVEVIIMKELLPNIYRLTTRIKVIGPFRIPAAMYAIKDDEKLILIDPFLLPKVKTLELEKLGAPTLLLITGEMHARDADAYRKRYGAKIFAHREAIPELEIAVDETFGDDETLPGDLRTIAMPGTMTGETVFLREQEKGILIAGDAIWNMRLNECGLFLGNVMRLLGWPEGLGTMPRRFMKDQKVASESYRRLFDYDFDAILMSHGQPILSGARGLLRTIIDA